eukprot:5825817-Amphidinium_carterae.1
MQLVLPVECAGTHHCAIPQNDQAIPQMTRYLLLIKMSGPKMVTDRALEQSKCAVMCWARWNLYSPDIQVDVTRTRCGAGLVLLCSK